MEASRISLGGKIYDLNHLNKTKKTNLRRKLIIEYIQSKPAGEYIKTGELQRVGQFSTSANAHSFVKRMIRDGVIMKHEGDKPRSIYYSVVGSVRVKKPANSEPSNLDPEVVEGRHNPDINGFVADMQKLGVKFTITITNENVVKEA
ncbi:MAG TPA: hypothetical protein VD907_07090 [Verrucomicrobiae bacterium]|nr:hypothetical protein [Verrucomicrobiae bacterium]